MFAKHYEFTHLMSPFFNRKHGTSWFTMNFPTTNLDQKTGFLVTWETFITPKLLVIRMDDPKWRTAIIGYQRNPMVQHFGFCQILPKSLYNRRSELCLNIVFYSDNGYIGHLSRQPTGVTKFSPFPFLPSHYCTQEFDT